MKELLNKIQKVSQKLKAIEKDMTVGSGSYSYKAVSDHSVILKVKEAEFENRIISIPIKQELHSSEVVRGVKKVKQNNAYESVESIVYVDVVKMTLRIYDIDSEDFMDVESFGRGLDSGDKGFGKASTYARKYALLNAYKIATGEDPDASPSVKGNMVTENEVKVKTINYLNDNVIYKNEVLKHFGASEISELTSSQLITISNNLIKKKLL